MTSAAKFIDYFVHDILDYTMLNKNAKNFLNNMEVFDIRTCIQEIIEIQEDKIEMKGIRIETTFEDFGDKTIKKNMIVKSD